jgi:hypothetical protein
MWVGEESVLLVYVPLGKWVGVVSGKAILTRTAD